MKYFAFAAALLCSPLPAFAQMQIDPQSMAMLAQAGFGGISSGNPEEDEMNAALAEMMITFGISADRLLRNEAQLNARYKAGEFDAFDTNGDGDFDPREIYKAGKAMGIDYIFVLP